MANREEEEEEGYLAKRFAEIANRGISRTEDAIIDDDDDIDAKPDADDEDNWDAEDDAQGRWSGELVYGYDREMSETEAAFYGQDRDYDAMNEYYGDDDE